MLSVLWHTMQKLLTTLNLLVRYIISDWLFFAWGHEVLTAGIGNVGTLPTADKSVGSGTVGAPACGDVMRFQIKVENGTIVDANFKTFGCGSAIASSSLVTELVKGKTLDEAVSIKNTEIAGHLSLPPVKLHCSMLAEDAVKAAVEDYRRKNTGSK